MADVTITVNGVTFRVPAGTNVVDAARIGGISIPVFCYHPRMKPVGMCRMCLVQVGTPRLDPATRQPMLGEDGRPVIAMMPKLQTGCTTPVSEGMVINTESDEVQFAQKGVLEFLLTSHPLDCPVCDKGGECPLQNLTMAWGPGNSRFDYNDKVHFEKPVHLGDLILLDRERCILCSRCVRFQDELADDPVLGFDNRGRNWMIISKSDPPFDSKFSGNTTDICPVGALTSADFRFKARVWELSSKPVVCTLCPVGCNLSLDMRYDQLMRVMPRENGAVNDIWICDKGRFGHRFIEHESRLTTPLIRKGGHLVEASWDEALALVAEKLAAVQSSRGGSAIAGLASPRLSNEDLYLFQKLFREYFGSHNLDHTLGSAADVDYDEHGALMGVGKGTNLMEMGAGSLVLVIGADPEEEAPLYVLRLRAMLERGAKLVVANMRPTKLERSATTRLYYQPGSELAFVRGLLRAVFDRVGHERLHLKHSGLEQLRKTLSDLSVEQAAELCGVPAETIRAVAQALLEAKQGLIMYGAEARSAGPGMSESLAVLAALTGKVGKPGSGLIALLPGGNSRGALDMGVRPDARAGYAVLSQRGLGAREVWPALREGRVKAVWIAGLDPAAQLPAARAALEAADFVVVQELFLTETAKLADVVLPAASVAEREGTYTNAELRVQRSRQARQAHGEARPDWQIIQGVAQHLSELSVPVAVPTQRVEESSQPVGGKGKSKGPGKTTAVTVAEPSTWDYLTPSEIAAEIAERVPGYAGITYSALAATGQGGDWGRQTNEAIFYDGTNYENSEGIGIQLPNLIEGQKTAVSLGLRPLSKPAHERSLLLVSQSLAYDGDLLLRGSLLERQIPQPYVALSQTDADKLNIKPGDTVRLDSAAGELTLSARVVDDVPAGVALIPSNLPNFSAAAVQTGPRTRVNLVKVVTG
ncbi:NADH-quinone oxidoreductase subunit NuoG [Candidatus Chloroploca sp. M-50]|uniref:NADH-quinone oxidoreductase n=1 Tax=Candidatus Chloroploca mongolica TaxID=2528176 RepID=A0ABS4DD82_9CHLR|nr:NADH-quinone oxidoreductase subunit NuoG [Candidatus Chloroploca mongolica]MBP1467279.1 NADH-quinone oxidoreductase subunit NuoG [Candidatus Chloroploca mongolica]